jgi:cell wall-associated NlpC family hydrolase
MKRFITLLFSVSLISTFGVAKHSKIENKYEAKTNRSTKKGAQKTTKYTLQSGDTLFAIARKNNTSIDALREANGIAKGEELKIGRSIKIPSGTTVKAKAKNEPTKLVLEDKKSKEQTKAVSKHSDKKNNTTVKHIATATKSYKVKKSDSLYSIAKRNGTTVAELKKANHFTSNKSLKVGQILLLSASGKESHPKTIKLTQKNDKLEIRKASSNRVVIEPKPTKKSFFALSGEDGILSIGRTSAKQKAIPQAAQKHLGKRYILGATGPYNFDCSGFTSYVCKNNGVSLPRTSIDQSRVGQKVARSNLKAGDLIFFDTSKSRRGYVNHVGIYMGNNKFIHASSSKRKVIITTLDGSFYDSRFKGGRRVAS